MSIARELAILAIAAATLSTAHAGSAVTSVAVGLSNKDTGATYSGTYSVFNSVVKIVITLPDASTGNSDSGQAAQDTSNQSPPPPKKEKSGATTTGALLPMYLPATFAQTLAATTGTSSGTAPLAAAPVTKPKTKVKTKPKTASPNTKTVADQCNSDLKAYAAARQTVIRAQSDEMVLASQLIAIHDAAKPEGQLSDDQKKAALELLSAYLEKSHTANIKTVSNAVSKWSAKARDLRELCPLKLTATIIEEEEPAVDHTFRLYFHHDDFSNDTITLQSAGGILTSASVSADDQTGNIAIAGAKLLGEIAFLTGPQAAVGFAGGAATAAALAGGRLMYSTADLKKAVAQLKAATDLAQSLKKLNGIISGLEDYLTMRDSLPVLSPSFPIEIDLHMGSLDADVKAANQELQGVSLDISAHCGELDTSNPENGDVSKVQPGIFVSSLRPCTVELDRTSDVFGFSVLKRVGFMAQDAQVVTVLPFDRGLFVLDKTTYEFSNGRLTKVDLSRPREVLGAVSLPLELITAFFSSISDGIKGKSSVLDAETARYNSQAALLNAKAALIKAQAPPPASPPSK